MKNLLLIFVLLLFSIQSFAGSCPDGSDPVKSISDDGTYFVYNCGGSAESSNETSSTKPNGLLPDALKQIKVVKDWEPIADWESVKEYVKLVPISEWKNKEWNCVDRIKNVNPYPAPDTHRAWFSCQSYVHAVSSNNPQILGDILLSWASASKDPMTVVPFADPRHTSAGYDLPSTIGTFAQFYAFWYDEIAFTPDERQRVDAYMTRKLLEEKFLPISRDHNGPRIKCDINDLSSIYSERTGTNNCGNVRMKVAVGEIMLGFRLENQTLLDKGHDDMYVVHAFINEDGININHASRGGNTVNYSWEYTYYSSLLAEIYDSVGYDYFEHTLPRGAKVHEHLSFNYRLLKDFKLTAQWAKYDVGSLWLPYSQIKNLSQEEYQKTDNGTNVYRWEDGDKEFVKAHTKFVKRYMPELYTFDVKNYMGSKFNDSPNFGVHPYMLHLGNNLIEENNNIERLQKQAELEDEKDDVSCKVSSLRGGEYIARWYVAIPEENWEPKYKGTDRLTLAKDNCNGKIHSNERFWPSSSDGDKLKNSSIRDKLKIRWLPNGHITISGDLVYWPLGRNLYTFLEGNLNSGKISGEHEEGDKITIEIISNSSETDSIFDSSESNSDGAELKTETPLVTTSNSDPTVSKVIEVIQGDKFIVEIAEPHELAGTNINLNLRNIDAPDAVRSCPKQLELGIKVKDIVAQKLSDASSIKLKNFRKTSKAVIADVIIDGKDLGAELIGKRYASDEFGYWKAYFCSALQSLTQREVIIHKQLSA